MSEAFRKIYLRHRALYETFICYFIYLFIPLFIYLFIYLFVYLFICFSFMILNLVKKGILEFGFITATDV